MKQTPAKKSARSPEAAKEAAPKVHRLDSTDPKLKYIGGSNFDAWNNTIANQAVTSIWHGTDPIMQWLASLPRILGVQKSEHVRRFRGH